MIINFSSCPKVIKIRELFNSCGKSMAKMASTMSWAGHGIQSAGICGEEVAKWGKQLVQDLQPGGQGSRDIRMPMLGVWHLHILQGVCVCCGAGSCHRK
jgi:hypothetical protein